MEKKCELCERLFSCFSETTDCWCKNFSLDDVTLKSSSKLFDDCLCDKCVNFLQKYEIPQLNNSYEILTQKGKFNIILKKKSEFVLQIYYEKYSYPLSKETFSTLDLALKNYFISISKLKDGNYSIVKSFEALDEHYRRIFTRVKYELLFD